MGMEIYNSINQMVVNFGDRLTRTVLKQLGETEEAGSHKILQMQRGHR